ncbi:(d)CMP kinase [Qingshengfaniella alkalisoli]|uniref:Cytidylate kinase n=1 Tax=Qingshengfaniella alkalisoli TaxID=2599296 RepID=A0A5B8I5P4_9RHOB|nr:(d)CMP kinase [Qingshengfaniella alkalisoli]QDY68665.1 (d)CMP kinase [Qingshengfaniella alkalisoli]
MIFTVAIDGPAAAGKGTIAKALAAHFGFAHLDTGLLYRATGRRVMDGEAPVAAAENLAADDLARTDLRTGDVGKAASEVAAVPEVRAALLQFQKAFARREGGAVLDGRDIGTVICPKAEVKLFVTASDERRAQRRHRELVQADPSLTVDQVLADLKERDARDAARDAAPMKAADDALLLDTTDLAIDAAVAQAVEAVGKALEQGRG